MPEFKLTLDSGVTVTCIPGYVRIARLHVLQDEDYFKFIYVDLNSKYAGDVYVDYQSPEDTVNTNEDTATSNSDGVTIALQLVPGDATIKLDPDADADTVIKVRLPSGTWNVQSNWSRYTLFLVLWQWPRDPSGEPPTLNVNS